MNRYIRKIFIFLITIAITNVALADNWSWISKNINDTHFYIDESTLKINGNYRQIWEMVDNPTVKGYGSRKNQIEYDCEKYMYRRTKMIVFDKAMGEGTKVSVNEEKLDWSFIKFDVSINKIFKKVCAQK
jgi:hypothetical protein